MLFTDRTDAGRRLAERLERLRDERPVVVGLPRGGVPVAYEVAHALGAPLDVIIVRKLGVPYHRELGFGAIGEGGARVIHDDIVRMSRAGKDELAEVERREEAELDRQARRFRGDRPRLSLAGRTVVVVDDGIATGATAEAACRVARAQGASRVVMAVPVTSPSALGPLSAEADEVVYLSAPAGFAAVGEWYRDFSQTADQEVVDLLARAAAERPDPARDADRGGAAGGGVAADPDPDPHPRGSNPGPGPDAAPDPDPAPGRDPASGPEDAGVPSAIVGTAAVLIPVADGAVRLPGDLTVPEGAPTVVLFAHGSGSSRHSPRNRAVAQELNRAGLGTLLFDLLTPEEEIDRANVFDIGLLAGRLTEVTRWVRRVSVPVCYFGASTGAAAALRSAAEPGADIAAVVSRGGRPDLAGDDRLPRVTAPTLLIVGGRDATVLDLNRQAQSRLRCENRLSVVPGAGHLFEEPGALRAVSDLALEWFRAHS
ncbi:alpha/beta family hydrolase [Streptomyces sp. XD-27]|uniref:phosphoribosyltransferase family protein n=1 Tax=Streptomyces sp. XD-27 TaxID=3062779 RepID=UPI0026F43048|nr:alpha/beta family hydrolase [Streptomyces sp. XD-27]WKX68818.1 phosphoribosyltransferase family protein [Streptomyces sp. XD-27]